MTPDKAAMLEAAAIIEKLLETPLGHIPARDTIIEASRIAAYLRAIAGDL